MAYRHLWYIYWPETSDAMHVSHTCCALSMQSWLGHYMTLSSLSFIFSVRDMGILIVTWAGKGE